MKTFSFFILLGVWQIGFAQAPTTLVEFNYAVSGYKDNLDKGQDVKAGYLVKELGGVQVYGDHRFQFRALIRKQKNELAGIMVTAKETIFNQTFFTCIPINNDALLQRYQSDLSKWPSGLILRYAQITSPTYASCTATTQNNIIGDR